VTVNEKPPTSVKESSARIPPGSRTPEEQAALDKFHAQIGPALVKGLNRAVLEQATEDQARKSKKP
jgi:hypothetical protein